MPDPLDISKHYDFYHDSTDISQGSAYFLRPSTKTVSILQQVGLLDNVSTGSSAPSDVNALWLDQSTDPAILKQNFGGGWIKVSFERIFGPSGIITEVLAYQTTPPVSPSNGDRYLVLATGTGTWAAHDGKLAEYINGAWIFEFVPKGRLVVNSATGDAYLGSGAVVTAISAGAGGAMTNPMTTAGDIIHAASGGTPSRLAIGDDGQVLTLASGLPAWVAASPMTAPGDTIYGAASGVPSRLAKGADGEILTLVSGLPSWLPAASSAAVVGSSILWHTATPPAGYFECDGAAVSRTTYADLFAVISDDYGNGDGSTTFNLPDFRGEFLRGWANGSANDPDRATRTNRGDGTTGDNVGTKQSGDFTNHDHGYVKTGSVIVQTGPGTSVASVGSVLATNSAGGNETRPRNVNVMLCIKY